MARYRTTISSNLAPAEAFAYMSDFSNALVWDPGVTAARRADVGEIGIGSAFELVARFAGRDVPLRYTVVELDPGRSVVLEARRPGFVSRDTIEVEPAAGGSRVSYDARLDFRGPGRLADPLMRVLFARTGRHATAGLQAALNP